MSSTKFIIVLLSILQVDKVFSENDYKKCFSQAVCMFGEKYNPEWIQTYPSPQCDGKYSEKANNELKELENNFNNSIHQFLKGLENICSCDEEKSAINATIDVMKMNKPNKNERSKCFGPVFCSDPHNKTFPTWMQIRPFITCSESEEEQENLSRKIAELFQSSIQHATTQLSIFLEKRSSVSSQQIIKELKATKLTTDPKGNIRYCYLPVVCLGEEFVKTTWRQILPVPGCRGHTPEFLRNKASVDFNFALKKILKVFEVSPTENCPACEITTMVPINQPIFTKETTVETSLEMTSQKWTTKIQTITKETYAETSIERTSQEPTTKIQTIPEETTAETSLEKTSQEFLIGIKTTTRESERTSIPLPCDEKYNTKATKSPGCFGAKCFKVTYSEYQNKNYEDAKQMCKDIGSDWNLANIYDQCYFDFIKEYLMENENPHSEFIVWIGMTLNPQNLTTYFLSGEEATFGNWWYPEKYPRNTASYTHLVIQYIEPRFGVTNLPPTINYYGALCEKNNT